MKKQQYSVAIMGLGRIAYSLGLDRKREQPASHSHAFGRHKGFRIAAGCDIDEARRNAWKKSYKQARVYEDYKQMMSQEKCDVVIIALPEELHLDAFRECCKYKPGLVVLEKPIAANLKDAKEISRLKTEHKIDVIINHERRYARNYKKMLSEVESGVLGPLKSVRGRILTNVPALKKGDEQDGQSSLIHDGTHLLDMIEFLSQEKIIINGAVSAGPVNKDETQGVVVNATVGGAALYMEFGMGADYFEFQIEMDFQKGRLRIGNGIMEVFYSRPSPYYEGFRSLMRQKLWPPYKRTGYFSGMVEACYGFLHRGRKIESSVEDSVHYLTLIEDIRDRLKAHKGK